MSSDETAIQKLVLEEKQKPPPPESRFSAEVQALLRALLGIKSPVPNRLTGYTGQKIVGTSGSPEQLPSIAIPDGFQLVVKAKKANTGTVYVGFSKGVASKGGSDFFSLAANEQVSYAIQNATAIWIDVSVSGEGVELTVEQ